MSEPGIAADLWARDARHYRTVLNDLIDLGADMARLLHQQATVEAALPGGGETRPVMAALGAAFDRVTRAVRRSIALARKVAEPLAAVHPARPRIAARQHIIRAVEDAIGRSAADHEAAGLQAELLDRLDSPDLADDIEDRPVADIIAEICRDLGLGAAPGTRPWKRRMPAELAVLRARAAAMPQPTRPAGGTGRTMQSDGIRPGYNRRCCDP